MTRDLVRAETPDLYGAYPRLSETQRTELITRGERRATSAGEVLQRAGDVTEDFLVVLDGRVGVVEDLGPSERLISVHGPGRFLGEIGMLTGQPLFLSSVVEEPGEVLVVGIEDLRRLVAADGRLADVILRALLVRRSLQLSLGAGFAIIGSRYSVDTRRLREFAARNRLPHHWIDLEQDEEAERLIRELSISHEQTPVVIWRGEVMRNPGNETLAAAVGLRSTPPNAIFDLIVVGAGPAGLAAAVYGASEGLATVTLDATASGGQAATATWIENYLGFPAGISGMELADRAVVQAKRFGAQLMVPATAVGLAARDGHHVIWLQTGERLSARAVVVATGVSYRQLDLPGLADLAASSVYYAATEIEADLCRGDPVVVVGGGNSAGQAAIFLARHAGRVLLVLRADDLSRDMSRYLAARIEQTPQIRVLLHSEIREVGGDRVLEEVTIADLTTGQHHVEAAKALFVFIGSSPHVGWLEDQIALDDRGFVCTGNQVPDIRPGAARLMLESSRPGVFAAGDIRSGSVKRVAAAVGDGALAVRLVHDLLARA
ncbi:MAG: FAD-dependent oxidoreductase [Nocardioidaceae bacterium]